MHSITTCATMRTRGKGLFAGGCRSYCLPLSREPDDPTTDFKTDRELECTNGGSLPNGAPRIARNLDTAFMTVHTTKSIRLSL
jgi:hypothetical protein